MTSRRGVLVILVSGFLFSACGLVGDSIAHAPLSHQTPTEVAMSWFRAINSDNPVAARQLFEPRQRDQIFWMNQPASEQSKFSSVACTQTAITDTTADVHCSFHESASATEGSPVTFWDISMEKNTQNEWLISNYGQG